MRVLHLFSNCKWTGPAEPALNLCWRLRALGVEAEFACAPDAGKSVNRVVASARERGIEPILEFHLRKHRHPLKNFQDVRRLRRYLHENPVDIVHCHLDNDHEIAARALRGLRIPLVRTSYEGVGLAPNRRRRAMMARTAVLIEPSEMARGHDLAAYGLPQERAAVVPNAIDTARFDPERALNLSPPAIPANAGIQDLRARWNIPADAYVVGIVARMQTHRHFEDLLEATKWLIEVVPNTHLLIVGRGTNQKTVVEQPARELGIADHVHITGYVEGDELIAAIQSFDVGVYLVPGSDGTCRAAREILSMGKPLVVADRGMLREIVVDGESGVVTDGRPASLFDALEGLGGEPERRTQMGAAARALAETRYTLEVQAAAVHAIYGRMLSVLS